MRSRQGTGQRARRTDRESHRVRRSNRQSASWTGATSPRGGRLYRVRILLPTWRAAERTTIGGARSSEHGELRRRPGPEREGQPRGRGPGTTRGRRTTWSGTGTPSGSASRVELPSRWAANGCGPCPSCPRYPPGWSTITATWNTRRGRPHAATSGVSSSTPRRIDYSPGTTPRLGGRGAATRRVPLRDRRRRSRRRASADAARGRPRPLQPSCCGQSGRWNHGMTSTIGSVQYVSASGTLARPSANGVSRYGGHSPPDPTGILRRRMQHRAR